MGEIGRGGPMVWRLALWGGIAAILLVPLVAMQVTDEVNWTGFDFAAAAVLLGGAAAIFEFAARLFDRRGRLIVGAALALVVAVIWAEGAVGIF